MGKVHVRRPLLAVMSFSPYKAVVSNAQVACRLETLLGPATKLSTKACAASGDADNSGVPTGLAT